AGREVPPLDRARHGRLARGRGPLPARADRLRRDRPLGPPARAALRRDEPRNPRRPEAPARGGGREGVPAPDLGALRRPGGRPPPPLGSRGGSPHDAGVPRGGAAGPRSGGALRPVAAAPPDAARRVGGRRRDGPRDLPSRLALDRLPAGDPPD